MVGTGASNIAYGRKLIASNNSSIFNMAQDIITRLGQRFKDQVGDLTMLELI